MRKVPKGLVFQKLWLMPDQMYHDVPDVRTADDAVLTIRLMIFFELLDIATMLEDDARPDRRLRQRGDVRRRRLHRPPRFRVVQGQHR